MHAVSANWKFRLYWTVLTVFCLGLLAVLISLAGSQPGIVWAFFVVLVCGVGATIDRFVGPGRWNGRRALKEASPRSMVRHEVGVSISALEAERLNLALKSVGEPTELIRGCAWMRGFPTDTEKRTALSHYVVHITGSRPPFGPLKKTRTSEDSVSRARRYLELPEATPRELAVEFLQRGASLRLDPRNEPAAKERAEREALTMCLEYRSLMGWI